MFTDKTPALNVSHSHPGAWLDLGRVINVPESEGAMPSGHCLPGPRAVLVNQRSPLGVRGWIGEVCGARPGRPAPPATGGASGGDDVGQRAGARVRASRPRTGTFSDPSCSSINACVSPPLVKAILKPWDHCENKVSFVLKFTEIISKFPWERNAYTALPASPRVHLYDNAQHKCQHVKKNKKLLKFCFLAAFCRLEPPRWFSPILWRLLRSDCRWLERSPRAPGSAPWTLWGTSASSACTRWVSTSAAPWRLQNPPLLTSHRDKERSRRTITSPYFPLLQLVQ